MNSSVGFRPDFELISNWITPGARILDLGCGDGALLAHLAKTRGVRGYGLEIDAKNVATCIAAGVSVIQADIDDGLPDFADASFDYVVMTEALQALVRPDKVLAEMLRVGKRAIVTFPNFGHWRVRWSLLRGHMPVTPTLPSEWYETQNIKLCTLADFEALCAKSSWTITERALLDRARRVNGGGLAIRAFPNLFGEIALYQLQRL